MSGRRFHPAANIFPVMSGNELDELARDIREHGQREPIVLHDDMILDGRNRFLACRKAGVEPVYHKWDGNGSPIAYVVSLNLHRRHLNESQRAMVAAKIVNLKDGQRADSIESAVSHKQAAEMLSVGRESVARARKVQREAVPELAEAVERGKVAVSTAAVIAEAPEDEQREIVARGKKEILAKAAEIRAERRKGAREALHSSGSNEYYTPSEYVEAARELMGGIDLDPATCEQANEVVRATKIFTARDDGHAQEWHGRVWLNPPYGRGENYESNQGRWSKKLVDEYEANRVAEAVMLVNAVTDREWFAPLWDCGICFVSKRIKFNTPDGGTDSPPHGNVLVYLGPRVRQFVTQFSKFGRCVIPRGWWSEAA